MGGRLERDCGRRIAGVDVGQDALGFLVGARGGRCVHQPESGAAHHRSRGGQLEAVAARFGLVGRREYRRQVADGSARHSDGDRLAGGVDHLAGDGALPHQVVDAGGIAAEIIDAAGRGPALAGGADRLVRFLGVLDLAGVGAGLWWEVLLPVAAGDDSPRRVERLGRQGRAVGAHVGDAAVLVQPLGSRHGARGREAQPCTGCLLQGGGDEWRRRSAPVRLGLPGGHGELRPVQGLGERRRSACVEHRNVASAKLALLVEVSTGGDAALVQRHQHCIEQFCRARCIRRRTAVAVGTCDSERLIGCRGRPGVERGGDAPVLGSPECHALPLALHDEAVGDTLHSPRGEPWRHLAPQHRRDLVAVETVEYAPRFLRIHQPPVEVAWVVDGLADGSGGDLVEHHAAHRDLRVEHLQQVPRDGLALAVLIGGEIELVGVAQQRFQASDLVTGCHHIDRFEAVVGVDAQRRPRLGLVGGRHLGGVAGQIPDVADGGFHHVLVAQQARDRARLRGRLDDDERSGHGDPR